MKMRTVKILGHTVRMGSKKHIELMDQVRHFNDLSKSETGSGQWQSLREVKDSRSAIASLAGLI